MKYFSLYSSKKKGFTLIEMIVSVAIFTVVAVIAVGALLKIVDANKKAQSLKTTINNINFTFESMSRDIRVGSRYRCYNLSFPSSFPDDTVLDPLPCDLSGKVTGSPSLPAANSWTLAFHSSNVYPKVGGGTCNLIHLYRFEFDNNKKLALRRFTQPDCENWTVAVGQLKNRWPSGAVFSTDIVVTEARLDVDTGGSVGQPKVFLRLKGYSGLKERNQTPFDVQTTISQRIDD